MCQIFDTIYGTVKSKACIQALVFPFPFHPTQGLFTGYTLLYILIAFLEVDGLWPDLFSIRHLASLAESLFRLRLTVHFFITLLSFFLIKIFHYFGWITEYSFWYIKEIYSSLLSPMLSLHTKFSNPILRHKVRWLSSQAKNNSNTKIEKTAIPYRIRASKLLTIQAFQPLDQPLATLKLSDT